MTDVELDVVAELGKVRLPLEAIAQLAVGDVIRLSLPLDERARICAGGATLFHGRPTASGHVVAVAIERPANESSSPCTAVPARTHVTSLRGANRRRTRACSAPGGAS